MKKLCTNYMNLGAQDRGVQKKNKCVKILLLGQAESGKSTTLKNFQLKFAPTAFRAEADSWRIVIYLNLLRSINVIFDQLCPPPTNRPSISLYESSNQPIYCSLEVRRFKLRLLPLKAVEVALSNLLEAEPYIQSLPLRPHSPSMLDQTSLLIFPRTQTESAKSDAISLSTSSTTDTSESSVHTSTTLEKWPLRYITPRLFRKSTISATRSLIEIADDSTPPSQSPNTQSPTYSTLVRVQSSTGWKDLARVQSATHYSRGRQDDLESARQVLHACAPDVEALWKSSEVRTSLKNYGIMLENQSGFFLNDVLRIAAMDYVPTDSDILRARLSTVGVEEHLLSMEHNTSIEWKIYDCGGLRSQRLAWTKYFNDVNVILFLVPISAFDQNLEEETSMNRLQDSFQLWHQLSSNRLLMSSDYVIFLNKCDLLREKLRAGIQFSRFIPNYGSQKNDFENIIQYIQRMLTTVYRRYRNGTKKPKGNLYMHMTSAVDAAATSKVLTLVQETVLIRHLREVTLV